VSCVNHVYLRPIRRFYFTFNMLASIYTSKTIFMSHDLRGVIIYKYHDRVIPVVCYIRNLYLCFSFLSWICAYGKLMCNDVLEVSFNGWSMCDITNKLQRPKGLLNLGCVTIRNFFRKQKVCWTQGVSISLEMPYIRISARPRPKYSYVWYKLQLWYGSFLPFRVK
jgi:hypothetical protein